MMHNKTLCQARMWTGLILLGVSFGYIEAAVVVYLRGFYEPMHQRLYPDRETGDLLPLIPLEDWQALGVSADDWTATELCREGATLILLVATALLVARNIRHGFAVFVFLFGLWDLFYYVFLKVLIDWPGSLLTWDILFLAPVPWLAPVLAPLIVALTMVIAGAYVMRREEQGQPILLSAIDWAMVSLGGVIVWLTFCFEYVGIPLGASAGSYPWTTFGTGWLLAVAGFVRGCVNGFIAVLEGATSAGAY
jgi:hypothetical protein